MAIGRFTGKHAFLTISGGFAIVFAVNGVMVWFAANNRPGMVVDNSYVASQQFNQWLESGRAQQELGWTIDAHAEQGQLLLTARDSRDHPLLGLAGDATITHPLGSEPAQSLKLQEVGDGRYVAGPLPEGRWVAEIRTHLGGQHYYLRTRLEPEPGR